MPSPISDRVPSRRDDPLMRPKALNRPKSPLTAADASSLIAAGNTKKRALGASREPGNGRYPRFFSRGAV